MPNHKAIQEEWNRLGAKLKRNDERLRPIIEEVGKPTPNFKSDPFSALATSILSQQLAPGAARAITQRVSALLPLSKWDPKVLIECSDQQLRDCGVSQRKATYLKNLSQFWLETKFSSKCRKLSDEELEKQLTSIVGVGQWTVHMFQIFCLGRVNILPVGDYGVRRGVQLLFGHSEAIKPRELPEIVGHWNGAYSVASWYVWQGLNRKLIGKA